MHWCEVGGRGGIKIAGARTGAATAVGALRRSIMSRMTSTLSRMLATSRITS